MVSLLSVVLSVCALGFIGNISIVTFLAYRRYYVEPHSAILTEKMDAYREILADIMALNREAMELGEEKFQTEAEYLVFDEQDSELYDLHATANETFNSKFYIIDKEVREAISDYLDYPATYHEEGTQLQPMFKKSGKVAEKMRKDLGLDNIYEQSDSD